MDGLEEGEFEAICCGGGGIDVRGIKWMGIWRKLLGFLSGISPEHTMEELRDELVPGGLLVYQYEKRTVEELREEFLTEIDGFDAKLCFLCPKSNGWAVIGRVDKCLPDAAIEVESISDSEVTIKVEESGPMAPLT